MTSKRLTVADLIFLEVAPPGREPQVRALKGKVDNPYAVAWASYNDEANPNHGKLGRFAGSSDVAGKSKGKNSKGKPQKVSKPKKAKSVKKTKAANSSGGLPQTLRDGMMCGATDWGKGALGMRQSDIYVLKSLCKENVEKSTYRFSESNLMEVVAPVREAGIEPQEGPVVKCVLITEGLGNRADMHYYGPECIRGGVGLFEGQPCFIDHQKRSEQQDQPERTVRDKCGYFKNVRAEEVDGRLGLVAELHYDLSATGRYAYDKACTAIHYRQEFPAGDKEYVGLSIAADGKLEERVVQVGDEVLDVKYVTEFTAVGSVDEVTSPARGGRFVQVLAR